MNARLPGALRPSRELTLTGTVVPDIRRPPTLVGTQWDPLRHGRCGSACFSHQFVRRCYVPDRHLSSSTSQKAVLRNQLKSGRAALTPQERGKSIAEVTKRAVKLATSLRENFSEQRKPIPVAAGYAATGSELDAFPLLRQLLRKGWQATLPVMAGSDKPLFFRTWSVDTKLLPGPFGIRQPPPDAPALRPDVVFLPLLAFDSHGNRLGYGGGFYDRTLASLRKTGPLSAVGLAFDCQFIDSLPTEPFDAPLEYVVTPTKLYRFTKSV